MSRPHLIAFLALAIVCALVGGCGSDAPESALVPTDGLYRGSEPPDLIPMPEFELRDVITGEDISPADVKGKVVLVTFIDTDCKDQCPLLASAIG
jgi:cytochrome oxidase Cu insertion factor (SCO1/SenC/PrrC family)